MPQSEGTPASATPPIATPAAVTPPAAPAAPPPAPADEHNPPWLKDRLERERKAVLSGLGVQSEADAKTALAAYKAAQEAAKSEAQRTAERLTALETQNATLAAQNAANLATIANRVAAELATLTQPQRDAVTKLSGDDVSRQLLAIDSLKPTWAAPASPAAPAAQATLPAPAQTVPNQPPPAPAGPTSPTNWLGQYKSQVANGQHVAAAVILATHPEIASDIHK